MVARSGALFYRSSGPILPWTRNYVDENDRPTVTLAQGLVTPPINDPQGETFGLMPDFTTGGYKGEVLPIAINLAIAQRSARGFNGSGRWANLGPSPNDMKGAGFDYFEKVLIKPSEANLGNVVSDTIINVVIQNTYRRDNQSITAIDNNAGAGITVLGAVPPANLAPNADKIYVVTVTTQGPPNINGTIDWTTTQGILTLTITGTRIIIFPYTPQADIQENLRWLTDVIRSADGSEQRHSLRTFARQSVAYEIKATTFSEINNIKNLFVDWTTRVFGVPLWWFERSVIEDVVALDLTVKVRNTGLDYADFRVGGLAMIYQEDEDGTFTIDTLQIADLANSLASPTSTQDTITFATPIQNNYDANLATVIPVVASILAEASQQSTPAAAESSEYSLSFDMVDNEANISVVEPGWWPELDDFDGNPTLVVNDPNFMSGNMLSEQWAQKMQRIDFDIGKFQQLTQELRARRSMPFKWVVEDTVKEWQIRTLLYYQKGQLRNLWVPTNRDDFELISNFSASATTLEVANWGFGKFVAGGTPWSGLRIQKIDGSVSYHRISSAVEIDTITDQLVIDPATSFAATVAEIERMDLMILARFAGDDLTITHQWHDAESDSLDSVIDVVTLGDVQS